MFQHTFTSAEVPSPSVELSPCPLSLQGQLTVNINIYGGYKGSYIVIMGKKMEITTIQGLGL